VARRAREERDAAHERAADAEDVEVHLKNFPVLISLGVLGGSIFV
jgi:hypothetical protein